MGRELMWSQRVCTSVCLFVCLPVRLRISKIASPNFNKFSGHDACGYGSVLRWRMRYTLCNFRFLNDVMFPYNGENARIKDAACVSSSSPGGGTSRTSDNIVWSSSTDGGTWGAVCRLWLYLVWECVLCGKSWVHQWLVVATYRLIMNAVSTDDSADTVSTPTWHSVVTCEPSERNSFSDRIGVGWVRPRTTSHCSHHYGGIYRVDTYLRIYMNDSGLYNIHTNQVWYEEYINYSRRRSRGGVVFTRVCLSVYPHDIPETAAAMITKLDIEMFHPKSWKPFILWSKAQSKEIQNGVRFCTLVSAGFF